MMAKLDMWKQRAQEVLRGDPNADQILRAFFGVLQFIHGRDWQGACHAASSVLYVLLREQGVPAHAVIGEVRGGIAVFSHSWSEIDGAVYDAAISKTLVKNDTFAPVMKGIDLESGNSTQVQYGIGTELRPDPDAARIRSMPFVEYMDGFPGHKRGLWGLAGEIGSRSGIYVNAGRARQRYSDTRWIIRQAGGDRPRE